MSEYTKDVQTADDLLATDDLAGFERFLAAKFGVQVEKCKAVTNGFHSDDEMAERSTDLPDWLWPESRATYSQADRRWVIYAIMKVEPMVTQPCFAY